MVFKEEYKHKAAASYKLDAQIPKTLSYYIKWATLLRYTVHGLSFAAFIVGSCRALFIH